MHLCAQDSWKTPQADRLNWSSHTGAYLRVGRCSLRGWGRALRWRHLAAQEEAGSMMAASPWKLGVVFSFTCRTPDRSITQEGMRNQASDSKSLTLYLRHCFCTGPCLLYRWHRHRLLET